MNDFYKLKIVEKKTLTPESVSIGLEIPDQLKNVFNYNPGQFVMVEKEIDGTKLRRYYSIYSPENSEVLRLGIKLKGTDGFARYAMHNLQTGDFLSVSKPMNDMPFILKNEPQKLLAVTIGSGITPFYSMIQTIVNKATKTKMVLVYGNHTPQKTMFYNELKSIEKQFPQNLKIYWVFSQTDEGNFAGRINQNVIQKVLQNEGTNFDAVYLIGPDDMKKNTAQLLKENNIEPANIHYRVYG